jgi:hypothetical protein
MNQRFIKTLSSNKQFYINLLSLFCSFNNFYKSDVIGNTFYINVSLFHMQNLFLAHN